MCKGVIKFYCKICKVFDKCEKTVFIYINVGFLHFLLFKNFPTREEKIEKKRWESFFEKSILDIYFCPFLTFQNIL